MTGTLINVGAVLAGTALGSVLAHLMPDRVRDTVMDGIGIVVVVLGVAEGLAMARPPLTGLVAGRAAGGVPVMVVLGSVVMGGLLGELVGIERALAGAGERLKRRFGRGQRRFHRGVRGRLAWCSASAPDDTRIGSRRTDRRLLAPCRQGHARRLRGAGVLVGSWP